MARRSGSGADSQQDAVDGFVDQWREQRPDLDPGPMLLLGRLYRLTAVLDNGIRPVFAEFGLTPSDFDVLATLRRWGSPMSPGELGRSVLVASGTVAKRLDRLERRGFVHRSPSPYDGRGRLVELTPEGVDRTDELAAKHWANEEHLLGALDESDQRQLAALLRKLLVAHE